MPIDVTDPAEIERGIHEGWAEPITDPTQIDFQARRRSAWIPYEVVAGRPVCPGPDTGRIGRRLGLWGENKTVDPVVFAGTQVLLIRRGDNGAWALPGGFLDLGETVNAALVRELQEETGLELDPHRVQLLDPLYVEDSRGTNESWIVTTPGIFEIPSTLPVTAASDAADARWVNLRGSVTAASEQLRLETGSGIWDHHRKIIILASVEAGILSGAVA